MRYIYIEFVGKWVSLRVSVLAMSMTRDKYEYIYIHIYTHSHGQEFYIINETCVGRKQRLVRLTD